MARMIRLALQSPEVKDMGDEEKTAPLDELHRLGALLNEQRRLLDEVNNEYKNATAIFEMKIEEIEEMMIAATKELREARDQRQKELEATRAKILEIWKVQEDLPKTIKTDDWQMTRRVNRFLEVLKAEPIFERLKEFGRTDIAKLNFDKRELLKMADMRMLPAETFKVEERNILAFKPKEESP